MDLIGIGAEGEIYFDADRGVAVKKRVSKKYRHPQIDKSIILKRTRAEAKLLKKLYPISPKLLSQTESEIEMEHIKGDLLKDILTNQPQLAKEIAKTVTILHNKDVMHGDLTTSNMMKSQGKVRLIDFGLAKTTTKIEDKAVDLHLFKQALISKHFQVEKEVWQSFIKYYSPDQKEQILKRLKEVSLRGRNK